MTASVTTSFTRAILHHLAQRNIKFDAALTEEINDYPDSARLPMALQDALWRSLDQLGDASLGLTIGREMLPQSFDTMGFLLLTSPSLSVAVDSLINYSPLVGEGGTFTRTHTNIGWQLSYEATFTTAVALRIEAIFASIASGARWVAGKAITPVKVSFRHAKRADTHLYLKAFGDANILFRQPQDAIVYASSDWHFKQREVNPAVQAQMLELANQQLAQLTPQPFPERVTILMKTQPCLSRAQLAASLAVSERTLTRKLDKAGISYQSLSQDIRKQHALDQICVPKVTQASLAEYLGYSDENAFAKAFKRWTGLGFRAYRKKYCHCQQ